MTSTHLAPDAAGPGPGQDGTPPPGPPPQPGHRAPRVRPRAEWPALAALLAVTAVLLLWNLSASGYANSFYSAAAQAGAQSWKAFLFGSFDAANAITVDKPPAALWPMALSVRLFGLGSWQLLVPQALMGVGTVAVLYFAVRRRAGVGAGLLAGALMALTPVAALMFRFNNPDALLCLLTVSALACFLRALEKGRTRWLVAAGALLGVAFLAKALQAWLVVPVLAGVYLACAPTRPWRRVVQLLWAGAALVASCGWWIALIELWPEDSRPYVGGSQHNSFLELTFAYNGLGRLTGDEPGSVGGGPGGGWGQTGVGRLFEGALGGQIAWLLPAAVLLLVAGLVVTRSASRTDPDRAALLTWGGALVITSVTFSLMSGIFHEYYTVALAPYIAAVVALGTSLLWSRRQHPAARGALAAALAVTSVWSFVLLGRYGDWYPALRWTVLVAGLASAAALLVVGRATSGTAGRLALVTAAVGVAAALAAPLGVTLNTVDTPHSGSIVTAGPTVTSGAGGFPGRGRGGQPPGGQGPPQQ
ncbi:glycosyltransferase family 39 protein, partial [Streptomyces sp. NPDC005438]|uniref:ArnT family glycosyltransferase n=1 Tax=Streptomyces sp. NPDC005438 TaxID=3156880 RepID=UPI0033A332AF